MRPRRSPGNTIEDLLIPLPTPTADVPELLKAPSNVSVVAEQTLALVGSNRVV